MKTPKLFTSIIFALVVVASVDATQAQNCPADIVSYWTFDAGDALDDVDGNDGMVFFATPVVGQVGGAMSFNGTSAFIEVPDDPSLHFMNELTIQFWVRPVLASGTSKSPQPVLYSICLIVRFYTNRPTSQVALWSEDFYKYTPIHV